MSYFNLAIREILVHPNTESEGRLYVHDYVGQDIYELSTVDMSTIGGPYAINLGGSLSGMGGIKDRLFCSVFSTNKLHELDPDTLTTLSGSGVTTPVTLPNYFEGGMGGMEERLFLGMYHIFGGDDKLFEIDPDTLLDLTGGGVTYPGTTGGLFGVGGTLTRLYCSDITSGKIYELDPDTLTDISGGGTAPVGGMIGDVGGTKSQLYITDYSTLMYEIDPLTLANLSGGGVAVPGVPLGLGDGIGGTKGE